LPLWPGVAVTAGRRAGVSVERDADGGVTIQPPSATSLAAAGVPTVEVQAETAGAHLEINSLPLVVGFDWDTAAREEVHRKIEQVVTLLDRSQLLIFLSADDLEMASAINDFLLRLLRLADTKPPKDVVAPQLRWLKARLVVFGAAGLAGAGATAGSDLVRLIISLVGGA
jgi:hypothetical protein